MAPARTKIARPAGSALTLSMNVAIAQEGPAPHLVQMIIVAQPVGAVTNRAMARVPSSVGRHRKVAAPRATGVWRASATRQLLKCNRQVGEADWFSAKSASYLRARQRDQLAQIDRPVPRSKCSRAPGVHADGRKPHLGK